MLHFIIHSLPLYLLQHIICFPEKKKKIPSFPGGSLVKNPPASVGDMGSISGPGRSHMSQAYDPQLLSLCCGAQKLQLLSPQATTTKAHMARACAPQ